MQVISATQARRRFRRIMKLLQQGALIRDHQEWKAGVCRLVPPEAP